MRGLSKLTKFFIICAVTGALGILCFLCGLAGGGLKDSEKLAERYSFIKTGSGKRTVTTQKADAFHAIEIKGDTDILLVGKDHYADLTGTGDEKVLKSDEEDALGENKVTVIRGANAPEPVICVEDGVLKIDSGKMDLDVISLNFNDELWQPVIVVCCPDSLMESLSISSNTGDIHCIGVSVKSADINLQYGDIRMSDGKSGSLDIVSDSGDIKLDDIEYDTAKVRLNNGDLSLTGKITGSTQLSTDAGDIRIETSLPKAEYALELDTRFGDIRIQEEGQKDIVLDNVPSHFSQEGSPNTITAKTGSGDLKVRFR